MRGYTGAQRIFTIVKFIWSTDIIGILLWSAPVYIQIQAYRGTLYPITHKQTGGIYTCTADFTTEWATL